MTLRLFFVAHAPTAATIDTAFPLDEPLTASGRAEAEALAGSFATPDTAWTSPALRAAETAAVLGLEAVPEPALRDLDAGDWAGRTLAEVAADAPEALRSWTHDTAAAPPGGESLDGLFGRIGPWMERVVHREGLGVAVTHAAVIRAAVILALRADRRSFWRIDIAPLSTTAFHVIEGRWSVCCVNSRVTSPPGRAIP